MKTRGKDHTASAEVADRLLTIKEVSELNWAENWYSLPFRCRPENTVRPHIQSCLRFRRSSLEGWFEQLTRDADTD